MIEVRYTRWKAILQVIFGTSVLSCGVLLIINTEPVFIGVIFMFAGIILMQIARLRLQERDTILCLTPNMVWTKEFGWQSWENLLFVLESNRNSCTIEIRRPTEFTPRFFEWVGALTISEAELSSWIKRFAINYRVDNKTVGATNLS